jgi:hypothetical protein
VNQVEKHFQAPVEKEKPNIFTSPNLRDHHYGFQKSGFTNLAQPRADWLLSPLSIFGNTLAMKFPDMVPCAT